MMQCTYWPSLRETVGKPFTTTFAKLGLRFAKPLEVAEKMAIPGWAPVRFKGDRRLLANVEAVFAEVFDFDELTCSLEDLAGAIHNAAIVTSTFGHSPKNPRARVVYETSRPLSAVEHAKLSPWLAERMTAAGQKPDPAAKDASRLWFVPAVPPGKANSYFHRVVQGPALDVDDLLARIPAPAPIAPTMAPRMSSGPVSADTVVERARKYLAACDVAIAGQGGHKTTFTVCQKLTRGFGLDAGTAFDLLLESGWNNACQPPWSMAELGRKVNESANAGRMQIGALRDARRRTG